MKKTLLERKLQAYYIIESYIPELVFKKLQDVKANSQLPDQCLKPITRKLF
jgi:hypothetical protein